MQGGVTVDTVKQQAFKVFDLLTEQEQSLVYERTKRLVPDDIATPDDIAIHFAAMAVYRRGETVSGSNINWDKL